MPDKTLLAYAERGRPVHLLEPDHAAAQAGVAAVAAAGVDVDALGESLQRQGARAFEADWASLLDAIDAKATALRPA